MWHAYFKNNQATNAMPSTLERQVPMNASACTQWRRCWHELLSWEKETLLAGLKGSIGTRTWAA
jgi:hypothetical protein